MGMLKEFKEFAVKGNVLDMAVGVIVGGGFGKVASSFLADVIMPPIGLLIGGVDFKNLAITLKHATPDAKAVTINYGTFITTVIDFVLVAFAVFLVVKMMNSFKRQTPTAPPAPSEKSCPECLMTIPIKARRCGHCSQPVAA